jgi:hypothetical protein
VRAASRLSEEVTVMAVKTVWVVTHICGHRESHELAAKRVSQRARYARWLATTDCTPCWRRKRIQQRDKQPTDRWVEQPAQLDNWETETNLPPLHGSDKALDWARQVRHHLVTTARQQLWLTDRDFAERIARPARTVTAASWWLDQRDSEADELEELVADASADDTIPTRPRQKGAPR